MGLSTQSGDRQFTDESVYDAALRRIRICYERFDRIAVAFSGGKDSTACLNLTAQVAKELGKLPVRAIFFDEECIPPETVEYVERVANRPDIALEWYCVPCEQRNACSSESPLWYPWAPEDRDKWARPLPSRALTVLPGNRTNRLPIPEIDPILCPPRHGTTAKIMGIRTQESMTRYAAIATKKDSDLAFLSNDLESRWITKAYPIYDWTTEDVWLAPLAFGWDYNRAYDVMDKAGISASQQRCSPAFGEQPLRKLHCFPACWPELWGRMSERVPGVNTAVRYANTELYGFGDVTIGESRTWADRTREALSDWPPVESAALAVKIRGIVRQHFFYTPDPLPDEVPHPVSGLCWKEIAKLAIVGNKLDRQRQKVQNRAAMAREKNGIESPFRAAREQGRVARSQRPSQE
jgi:predicted phosphoadenosine phosphosulfate sulfurtransferase